MGACFEQSGDPVEPWRHGSTAVGAAAPTTKWGDTVDVHVMLGVFAYLDGDVECARNVLDASGQAPVADRHGADLRSWLHVALCVHDGELRAARAAAREAVRYPDVEVESPAGLLCLAALAELESRLGDVVAATELRRLVAAQTLAGSGDRGDREPFAELAATHDVFSIAARHHRARRGALTRRERAVLHLLRGSLTLPEIARELGVSVNTVKSQTRQVYRKLGVNSRAEAVVHAGAWASL